MKEYNGWKNRQTWNVSLWINNDEGLYNMLVKYVDQAKRSTYLGFIRWAGLEGQRTPDNISFSGTRLDYRALNEMVREVMS